MREIWEKYDQLEFWRGALIQGENGVRKTAVVGAGKPDIWPRARPWWFCASGGIVPSLIQISLARKRPRHANRIYYRGASSTLMQDIANRCVRNMNRILCADRIAEHLTSMDYLLCLALVAQQSPAPTSTKSCPVSTHVSWRRKRANGARFTRRVHHCG
jgi:hypothetical protein